MNRHKKAIVSFKRFLDETPKEKLDEIVARIDAMDIEGPTVEEYFMTMKNKNQLVKPSKKTS